MREGDFPEITENYTYLDSACMSLRPNKVIEKIEEYYREYPGCPGRSNHGVAEKVSSEVEEARAKVAGFINASPGNMVFTSGTTESINTVAKGFNYNKAIISDREHNSNLLPWQNGELKGVSAEGGFNISRLSSILEEDDIVSVTHVSNLDGFKLPVEEISKVVKENDAYLMIDAAQSIPHQNFSVDKFSPDFVAFSGHKMLGPSGTGGLYVSDRVKESVKPLKIGGGAVNNSSYTGMNRKEFPHYMESGLPNVAGIIGLGAAVDYLEDIGMDKAEIHEQELSDLFRRELEDISGVEMLNPEYNGVFSLNIEGMDSHEASLHMDKRNIAVRSGQHCVHSYFRNLSWESTLRASFYLYNTEEDIREISQALKDLCYLS